MIRDAKPADVGRILELGERFFNEAGWPRVATWDAMSVVDTLERLATEGVLLVAEDGGRVVGIAGAPVGPAYFNSAVLMSQELFWYVDKDVRGVGMPMLDALEAGCIAKGSHVQCVINDDRDDVALKRIPVPNGTIIDIPPNKINRDPNPTGRAVVFLSSAMFVWCFVGISGS